MNLHRFRLPVALVLITSIGAVAGTFMPRSNLATWKSGLGAQTQIESSSTFCSGLGAAHTSALLFNSTDVNRTVDVELTGGASVVTQQVVLRPHATKSISPNLRAASGSIALRAQIRGGGVVAEVGNGSSAVACHAEGVADWYASGLSTLKGTAVTLSIVNPTATATVLNVTLWSSLGFQAPTPLQGLVVAPSSQLTVAIDHYVVDENDVAVAVHALRGNFVASAQQGSGPSASLLAGQRAASQSMWFPVIHTEAKSTATLQILNPSTRRMANVGVKLLVPGYDLAPFTVTLNPASTASLVLVPDSRVPDAGIGIAHVNADVPVVVTLVSSVGNDHVWTAPSVPLMQLAWLGASHDASAVQLVNVSNTTSHVTMAVYRGRHAVVTAFDVRARALASLPTSVANATSVVLSASSAVVLAGPLSSSGSEPGLDGR